MQQQLVPNLWFENEALEAAEFYVSIFPDSKILDVAHFTEAGPRPAGTVMSVEFELNGNRIVGINGGPEYTFSEAISFQVGCQDQAEVDRYWSELGEGGEPGPCGWLKDKFGLSWQIVPRRLVELLEDPDKDKAQRVMAAMLKMGKIEIDELERAAAAA